VGIIEVRGRENKNDRCRDKSRLFEDGENRDMDLAAELDARKMLGLY